MNQQINLYLDEFRNEPDALGVANILRFQVAVVLILAMISAWDYFARWQMQNELNSRRIEVVEAADRNNALRESFGRQSESQQLLEEVSGVEQSLSEKRALLRFMEGREFGNTEGFSEYLADLSRFHITGLRLTQINLQAGGQSIRLGGEVSRAEFVPLYLQNLRQGQSYLGRNFETLKIEELDSEGQVSSSSLYFDVVSTGQY